MILKYFTFILLLSICLQYTECQEAASFKNVSSLYSLMGYGLDFEDFAMENCRRSCSGTGNRICYHKLVVEHYAAMGAACGGCARGIFKDCFKPQCVTADGLERAIITANRQMPAPWIEVCQNDIIVVDIVNHLHAEATSIHWHGQLQKGTQYMDGVPYVTQCPISAASNFRYIFDAADAGTYFYHSHSGLQRFSGLYGGLIVRSPTDSHAALYDQDTHVMIVKEWKHEAPESFVVGLPTAKPGLLPEAVLINGKGKFALDATLKNFTETPYTTFYIKSGLRYRIRIINAGSTPCPLEIQIENHRMTVIAVDGVNVDPVTVDTLTTFTGERYDIVVFANQPIDLYWIQVRAIGVCLKSKLFQNAILSYKPKEIYSTELPFTLRTFEGYPQGKTHNNYDTPCDSTNNVCISEYTSAAAPDLWKRQVDQKLYFTIGNQAMNTTSFFNNKTYLPFLNSAGESISLYTLNENSYVHTASPLLSQPDDVDRSKFCVYGQPNPDHCKDQEICTCTNVVNLIPNGVIEIAIISTIPNPTVHHPIHVHGFRFSVIAEGQFLNVTGGLTVAKVKELEASGVLKNKNADAIQKDVIVVKTKGVAIIRFIADNPGQWLVHCHIEDHMNYGMMLVMNVPGVVPPVPYKFPQCGDFY